MVFKALVLIFIIRTGLLNSEMTVLNKNENSVEIFRMHERCSYWIAPVFDVNMYAYLNF